MPAPRPLQRELPRVHQDGRIKFGPVLALARAHRRDRRALEASGILRTGATCLLHRLDRVRADMEPVRRDIGQDRAFWSVDNLPTTVMRRVRREHFGHVWFESEPVEAPLPTEQKAAA